MGTRHLIEVKDENGEYKIAQYCQWDGYPTGAGVGIVDFLKKKGNIEKLSQALKKVRFIDFEKDKEFVDELNESLTQDTTSDKVREYINNYLSRDVGFDILQNVCDFKGEELLLRNSGEFKKDHISCEWHYVIDLQQRKLYIWKEEFSFDKLPTKTKLKKIGEE